MERTRPARQEWCVPSRYNRRLGAGTDSISGRVAFRYPNFRYHLGARFLSAAASEMQAVAVAWQVYGITHRALDLGLVGLAQFLPGIFLFLLAGHAADRIPRRRILLVCNLAFALCSALLLALTAAGGRAVWPIYLVLLWNGVVRTFNMPAGQALLPLLVEERHFANAVAWNSSVYQIATVTGPVIGGLLFGWTGSPIPVYVTAGLCYVTAFGLTSMLKLPPVVRQAASLRMVLDGFRYIWRTKLILGAISLDLFAVLLGGAVALLPVYAREILNAGATGLGILRSAPGLGAVITAVIVAHHPLRRKAGAIMLWCVFGFGLLTVVFGVSRSMLLSLTALVLLGACDMVSVIVRHTLIQLSTPDQMRGRVSAVNMVFIGASNEVGQFESGITAQWFGTVPAVVLGGLGTILVVALWARLFPVLRRVDKLANATP